MSEKKKFLLRVDPELYAALEKWAADELRSANAQIEYVLTHAVRQAGRLKSRVSKKRAGTLVIGPFLRWAPGEHGRRHDNLQPA
ncbi:MAG: hypothetical protein ACRDIC_12680 [bacterium]